MTAERDSRYEESNTTSVGKAREILHHHLKMLWAHPERANEIPPLMLWGPPGIGKSAVIRELTDELEIGFIDVRLAQREPVDIRGLPVPREDREGVDWIISSDWPREGQEDYVDRGIILFDELTAADPSLQVAAYEFILDRRLGKLYEVPKGWYIVAAGNRTEDAAVARTMSSALANRFLHLELAAKSKDWIEWANLKGVEPNVIAFIRYRPGLLFSMTGNRERGWPSPRSWERVSLELQMAQETGLSRGSQRTIVEGLVGTGAAIEFLGFVEWAEKIPDVEGMLRGDVSIQFPERPDQRYAMVSAAVYIMLQSDDAHALINGFLTLLLDIPNDWSQFAHHDLTSTLGTQKRFELLQSIMENELHEKVEDKLFHDTEKEDES